MGPKQSYFWQENKGFQLTQERRVEKTDNVHSRSISMGEEEKQLNCDGAGTECLERVRGPEKLRNRGESPKGFCFGFEAVLLCTAVWSGIHELPASTPQVLSSQCLSLRAYSLCSTPMLPRCWQGVKLGYLRIYLLGDTAPHFPSLNRFCVISVLAYSHHWHQMFSTFYYFQ